MYFQCKLYVTSNVLQVLHILKHLKVNYLDKSPITARKKSPFVDSNDSMLVDTDTGCKFKLHAQF